MAEHLESPAIHERVGRMDRPATAFTSEEKRRLFKGMVVGELEAGFLRYSKREQLIGYAAQLGMSEFEAMLLIAEAQYRADQIEPLHFESAATLGSLTRPDAWSIPMRLSFALVAAIFIDRAMIYWLCR
jgi:hypothetical protein